MLEETIPLLNNKQRKDLLLASGYKTVQKQMTCSMNLNAFCKLINKVLETKVRTDCDKDRFIDAFIEEANNQIDNCNFESSLR